MQKSRLFAPILSIVGFAVFLANVLMGAMGGTTFLTDIQEMLVLFATCAVFVIFILQQERARNAKASQNQP